MGHYYDEMIKKIKDSASLQTIYDLEHYTMQNEPFMRELTVIPLDKTISAATLKLLEHTRANILEDERYLSRFYVIKEEQSDCVYQVFFIIGAGKNGSGNFVKDDMRSVLNILSDLNEEFSDVACLEMQADRLDDVSDWLVTFRI